MKIQKTFELKQAFSQNFAKMIYFLIPKCCPIVSNQ